MQPFLPRFVFASLVALAALAAHAGGQVSVSFTEPDKFTDLQRGWLPDKSLLDGLTEHLQTLGPKYLPDGQVLHVEVIDVDLAGSIEYTHRMSQVRVLRNVTSPRITLRYRLESADKMAPMTEVSLRDAAYLSHINRYGSGDPLRYEKHMLDDWFRRAFAAAK